MKRVLGQAERRFPFLWQCFAPYLTTLASKPAAVARQHRLWLYLERGAYNDIGATEAVLVAACSFLGLAPAEFIARFELQQGVARLVRDPEAFHDTFAEIRYVVDLRDLGFTELEKLPRSRHTGVRRADFRGTRHGVTYAIEVKVVRDEVDNTPHGFRVAGELGEWRRIALRMLTNNIVHELVTNGARDQLLATKAEFALDRTLLTFETRRLIVAIPLDPITPAEVREGLRRALDAVSGVDHIACKWLVPLPSDQGLVVEPALP